MAQESLTDDQVEQEIARLQKSPHVKLANQELRLRKRRRMYMYQLRQLEKKGMALEEAGLDYEALRRMYLTEDMEE